MQVGSTASLLELGLADSPLATFRALTSQRKRKELCQKMKVFSLISSSVEVKSGQMLQRKVIGQTTICLCWLLRLNDTSFLNRFSFSRLAFAGFNSLIAYSCSVSSTAR